MKKFFIKNKITAYQQLMRIDKPIGMLLLLWPTLWALWIATPGFPRLDILVIFITGVCLMRAAGCVINDYVDRKFDGLVRRTANRPMPQGKISEKEACVLFIILLLPLFILVQLLNIMTIILSSIALVLTCIYPFMKRYTYLPQVILGVTFSWSILMVFSAVSEALPLNCWLMFLMNILWVISYDTQYAMMDIDDDIKIGVKSTAIFFNRYNRLTIGILQTCILIMIIIFGFLNKLNWKFYWIILAIGLLFLYQQKLIAKCKCEAYFQAFMNNNYIGPIILLGLITSF